MTLSIIESKTMVDADTKKRVKREATNWEKRLVMHIIHKNNFCKLIRKRKESNRTMNKRLEQALYRRVNTNGQDKEKDILSY